MTAEAVVVQLLDVGDGPFYLPVGNEVQVFEAAWRRGLAIMLKGPTGCGKDPLRGGDGAPAGTGALHRSWS